MEYSIPSPIKLPTSLITTDLPAFVMGIVNVTPDSFWEQSRAATAREAVKRALSLVGEGAHIIDIGAESSRPGAQYIDESEQIRRLVPVIEAVRKETGCPISVDTRSLAVFKAAHEAGADILNDIAALEDDAGLVFYCAEHKNPVILMHKRGDPAVMQQNTSYRDVVREVGDYFASRLEYALGAGIRRENIILDPGVGFGKDCGANVRLIRNSRSFSERFGCPVLIGLSRKRFIGGMLRPDSINGGQGPDSADERLYGTLAANMLAVQYGAALLRVHDVRATVDCLKVIRSMANDVS